MRALDLFCGTKSVAKILEETHETETLDFDPRFEPSILTSILDWDYTVYPPGHFDIIWLSPPCTRYSNARSMGGPRNMEELADPLVVAALRAVEYL